MLASARPFRGESSVESMNAILKEQPPELSEKNLKVAPGIERIVRRCLEKSPERRFQSAADLAFAIEALSGTNASGTSHAPPAAAVEAASRRRFVWPLAIAAALALAVAAFFLGGRLLERPPTSFKQVIYGRGYISAARFTPDGESVVYSAAWRGKPAEIFTARVDSVASRSLGVPSAHVLGVSRNGDLAISLDRYYERLWTPVGTLGRVPLSGGAVRTLKENVGDADISSDGKELAVVRVANSQRILEYPSGKALFTTNGWVSHPRISPRGDVVAFLEHPFLGDDRGYVDVV